MKDYFVLVEIQVSCGDHDLKTFTPKSHDDWDEALCRKEACCLARHFREKYPADEVVVRSIINHFENF